MKAGDESLGESWREKNREYIARQKRNLNEDNTKKRKRDVIEDGEKTAAIKELTGQKRKNKLLAHNPDLEKAQNVPIVEPVEKADTVEKAGKRKKKKLFADAFRAVPEGRSRNANGVRLAVTA